MSSRGVPKREEALLPGLVVYGKCGHRLTTRYKTDRKPCYHCDRHTQELPAAPCGHIAAGTLDRLVADEVLRALAPAAVELSLHAIETVEQERLRLHDPWQLELEQAEREVSRAKRHDRTVEPENRLAARTLKAR